jgi:quercetin dioxygenase-like cupin family protein
MPRSTTARAPRITGLLVPALVLVSVFVWVLVAACSPLSTAATPAASGGGGIVRSDLGDALPDTAPGQRLNLWHYTIPAGESLVPHEHPGWQIARITAGTLTYNIIEGDALVIRAGGARETYSAGDVVTLATGDTVVENPGTKHFGANDGTEPVEIYTASLFEADQPPAIALPTPLTSPSPSP